MTHIIDTREDEMDEGQQLVLNGYKFTLVRAADGHWMAVPDDPNWLFTELNKVEPPKELPKRFR